MTLEHRLLVGLDDIKAIPLECKKCGIRLSLSPDSITRDDMNACPSCRTHWLTDSVTQGRFPTSGLRHFLILLASSRKTQREGDDSAVDVRVFLEFDAPKPGA